MGEVVDYYLAEDLTCDAVVLRVYFWDLVDLRLSNGDTVKNVRRAMFWEGLEGWTNTGRFLRRNREEDRQPYVVPKRPRR